jgi:hypothetical protein
VCLEDASRPALTWGSLAPSVAGLERRGCKALQRGVDGRAASMSGQLGLDDKTPHPWAAEEAVVTRVQERSQRHTRRSHEHVASCTQSRELVRLSSSQKPFVWPYLVGYEEVEVQPLYELRVVVTPQHKRIGQLSKQTPAVKT